MPELCPQVRCCLPRVECYCVEECSDWYESTGDFASILQGTADISTMRRAVERSKVFTFLLTVQRLACRSNLAVGLQLDYVSVERWWNQESLRPSMTKAVTGAVAAERDRLAACEARGAELSQKIKGMAAPELLTSAAAGGELKVPCHLATIWAGLRGGGGASLKVLLADVAVVACSTLPSSSPSLLLSVSSSLLSLMTLAWVIDRLFVARNGMKVRRFQCLRRRRS